MGSFIKISYTYTISWEDLNKIFMYKEEKSEK